MRKTVILTAIICAIGWIFAPASAMASENEPSPWEGDIELGYLMSTGNTETRSLNAALGVGYKTAKWGHRLAYETIYSYEKEEGTTAQRFLVSGRTNYHFDDRNAAYGLSLYENDRFAGYDYQLTLSVGYNRQIMMTDRVEWSAEIGPGYRLTEFSDDNGSTEEEAILHVGTDFLYRFTDTMSFREVLSVDAGAENTIVRSVSALRITLRDSLSLRISHTIRHVTDVPEDTEKTDTETFVSLVYDF